MNNFRFGNRSGGGRDSYRRGSGDRDFGRPEMHDAVCDECGRDCQVPFAPTGSKPIFCSDCFEKKGGRDGGRGGDDRSSRRNSFDRPRFGGRDGGRPQRDNASGNADMVKLNKNIEMLNNKLDKLISVMAGGSEPKGEKHDGKKKKEKGGAIAQMVASLKSNEVKSEKKKEAAKVIEPKPKAKKKSAKKSEK